MSIINIKSARYGTQWHIALSQMLLILIQITIFLLMNAFTAVTGLPVPESEFFFTLPITKLSPQNIAWQPDTS